MQKRNNCRHSEYTIKRVQPYPQFNTIENAETEFSENLEKEEEDLCLEQSYSVLL